MLVLLLVYVLRAFSACVFSKGRVIYKYLVCGDGALYEKNQVCSNDAYNYADCYFGKSVADDFLCVLDVAEFVFFDVFCDACDGFIFSVPEPA